MWNSPELSDPKQSQQDILQNSVLAARPPAPSRPPIVVREHDLPGLLSAAFDALMTSPRVAGALLQEVERASVVSLRHGWSDVVVPGSRVLYREGLIGPPRWTTLVMPQMADKSKGALSVLSSLGAGLLGLSIGQTISWEDRHGGVSRLEIINVSHPDDDGVFS